MQVPRRAAALIVAHPGHELLLHRWLETSQPIVSVLTDGSGRASTSRIASTARVLNRTGSIAGPVFGKFPDRQLYDAILAGDRAFFTTILSELTRMLVHCGANIVVSDALEGYSPVHDLCYWLASRASAIAGTRSGRTIRHYHFAVAALDDRSSAELPREMTRLALDDSAIARKELAARSYPELAAEVAAAVRRYGVSVFRRETLIPTRSDALLDSCQNRHPSYEELGDQLVRMGAYRRAIRYRDHIEPLVNHLRACAEEASLASRCSG